ncbi:hypothetical protein BT96DRAFT_162506 [Gymnopus androsaceus JB14]|uniref:Secreted peptide n=1 Tax=Gymnopus androsaceus JB14 TaxID=1447944 RepID=A0A6A4H9U3_9AGAR|nr:hypothetical protein BT96DRAFT_162506 [Gymnopus androsaceus JB14]
MSTLTDCLFLCLLSSLLLRTHDPSFRISRTPHPFACFLAGTQLFLHFLTLYFTPSCFLVLAHLISLTTGTLTS